MRCGAEAELALRLGCGEGKGESGTFAELRFGPDAAAEALDDSLADGEAEPGARVLILV